MGLQPSVEQRSRYELCRSMRQTNKTQKPSAITKHRRWLTQFASAVKQSQLDRIEDQLTKEKKEEDLRNKGADEARKRVDTKEENAAASTTLSVTETANASKKAKPKWAMTEEEALESELNESDMLVDFAESLDFEKFINDYEVREALAIMRDRVQEIVKSEGLDATDVIRKESEQHTDNKTAEQISVKAPTIKGSTAEDRDAWNSSTTLGGRIRSAVSAEAVVLAEKLLSQSETLRQVYTKQSLAKMLQEATIPSPSAALTAALATETSNPAPKTVSVAAENTADQTSKRRVLTDLKKSKEYVQNLPYLYRCPSI